MFDVGWSELLVIGVVALIAIGPKELPAVLRTCGQWMGKIRRMAAEFQGQFQEAMREAEMADIKKQVDEMTTAASDFSNFDPLGTVRKEIDSLTGDPLSTNTPSAPAEAAAALPEVAAPSAPAPSTPAPDSPDVAVPQAAAAPAQADLAVAPEAPKPASAPTSGSGG